MFVSSYLPVMPSDSMKDSTNSPAVKADDKDIYDEVCFKSIHPTSDKKNSSTLQFTIFFLFSTHYLFLHVDQIHYSISYHLLHLFILLIHNISAIDTYFRLV